MAGKKGRRHLGPSVIVVCPTCNDEFKAPRSIVERGQGKFCSARCYGDYRSKYIRGARIGKKWTGDNAIDCKQCRKRVRITPKRFGKARFCSRKCMGAYRRANHSGPDSPYWTGVTKSCVVCGGLFHIKRCQSEKKKTCGRVICRRELKSIQASGDGNPAWAGGKSREPYPSYFNTRLKRKIRERDGNICRLCQKGEAENGKKLAVHHIDYVKNNCSETNLTALCDACNKAVNTGRQYWTVYFQSLMKGVAA